MAAVLIIPSKFTAVDKFTPVMKRMTAASSTFAQKTRASFDMINIADRKMRNGFQKTINKLGKLGRLGAGLSAFMILSTVTQANIELDDSLASLSAITGVSGKAFTGFREEVDRVSQSQKIFAADTAKAFELVGSAKPELLESAEALGKVTEAAIILGKAGKLEVEDAVNSLTVSMNQFGAGAERASEFVDILATAQQKGSGTVRYLSEAMVNAGGTAKAFGNSFADTVAILEGFAKAGVPASEAGNMLSGILSKLSKNTNKDFNPQFTKATDIIDNLAKANLSYTELLDMTDALGAKWLTTIINQNDVVQKLTGNLYEVGNAQAQADTQSASLGTKIQELTDSFKNAVTSTDESNIALDLLKGILTFVANNMNILIGIVTTAVVAYGAFKAALWATRAATIAYNVAVGIGTAIQGASAMALRGSITSLLAYKAAMIVYTGVQWAANAALWGFPLTWIIAAIIAVVGAIVGLIAYWDDLVNWIKTSDSWFAKFIRASLYPIIVVFKVIGAVIEWIIEKWSSLVEWIKTSDNWFAKFVRGVLSEMAEAFRQIGVAIDWLGNMFSSLWDWISNIENWIPQSLLDVIDMFSDATQGELGVEVAGAGGVGAINPDAAIESSRISREEKITNSNVDVNIKAPEGLVEEIESDTGDIPVRLTTTM